MNQTTKEKQTTILSALIAQVAEGDLEVHAIAQGQALGFWNGKDLVGAVSADQVVQTPDTSPTLTLPKGATASWTIEGEHIMGKIVWQAMDARDAVHSAAPGSDTYDSEI